MWQRGIVLRSLELTSRQYTDISYRIAADRPSVVNCLTVAVSGYDSWELEVPFPRNRSCQEGVVFFVFVVQKFSVNQDDERKNGGPNNKRQTVGRKT